MVSHKKLIKNGMVFFGDRQGEYDILINEQGKIEKILDKNSCAEDGISEGVEVIDAGGLWIVPGGVDAHVHLDYKMGDVSTTDDFYDGSRAALAGGTTSIIDFCQPVSGQSAKECIAERKRLASRSAVDYAFHFIFTEEYKKQLQQLDDIKDEGIGSYKAYTTYDGITLNTGDLRLIMEKIGPEAVLMVHAEDNDIINELLEEKEEEGLTDMEELYYTRPNLAEEMAVSELAVLQREMGTKVCIAHTSTKQTVDIKRREKSLGNEFYLETCPHYLAFTNDVYKTDRGGLYAVNPPLKTEEDREELWKGILDGSIDLISTDHCPFSLEQKMAEKDFRKVPCGMGGLQTRMQFLFSEGVMERGLSMDRFVELTSKDAAKIYGLYPQKGALQEGSDADMVMIEPSAKWTYTKNNFAGKCDYDIFQNREFRGKIVKVISRGETVFEDGQLDAPEGRGKYIFIKK